MKRLIALFSALMLLFTAVCCAETVYGVKGEPYYHKDASCEYGLLGYEARMESPSKGTLTTAEACHMRACPSCASEWTPYFTAAFPKWEQDVKPWVTGSANEVSDKLKKQWGGNVAAKIDAKVKESKLNMLNTTEYPVDYAGVFRNASGCYTVLMVNPTVSRAEKYSRVLGCEFWVLSADYSMNELIALNNAMVLIMGADTGSVMCINSCGIDVVANRVEIGTSDTTDKNLNLICACVEALGFERDMVKIYNTDEVFSWEF